MWRVRRVIAESSLNGPLNYAALIGSAVYGVDKKRGSEIVLDQAGCGHCGHDHNQRAENQPRRPDCRACAGDRHSRSEYSAAFRAELGREVGQVISAFDTVGSER